MDGTNKRELTAETYCQHGYPEAKLSNIGTLCTLTSW